MNKKEFIESISTVFKEISNPTYLEQVVYSQVKGEKIQDDLLVQLENVLLKHAREQYEKVLHVKTKSSEVRTTVSVMEMCEVPDEAWD